MSLGDMRDTPSSPLPTARLGLLAFPPSPIEIFLAENQTMDPKLTLVPWTPPLYLCA
jgi:hypothetical protein